MNKNEKLLFKASETGNLAMAIKAIKPLLFVLRTDVNVKNEYGDTALMLTAIKGYRDIAEQLIFHKALINEKNPKGDTALIFAARHNHKSIVRLLLDNGVDVNAVNNDGESALTCALRNNNNSLAEMLVANGADVAIENGLPLLLALETSSDKLIRAIIAANAPINIKDKNGDTPLILAIVWHNNEIAKFLIAKNVYVNAVNNYGTTALVQAVRNNNLELVELLIAKKADVNDQNGAALLYAIEHGFKAIAEVLIEYGTKITTSHGAALIHAYTNGHRNMAELLLCKKTDATGYDAALIGVLEKGSRELADIPIAKSAADNVRSKSSTLALIHALQQGHNDLAALLSARRLPDITDTDEEEPVTSTIDSRDEQTLRLSDFVLILIYDNHSIREKTFDLLCLFNQKHYATRRYIEKRLSNNSSGELTVFGVKRVVNGKYFIVMQNPDNGFWGSMENTLLNDNKCAPQKNLILSYQEILSFSDPEKTKG